jgi:type IV pilus assembly protein PilY1
VGLRFTAPIPKGAQVTKAYLEFKVASVSKAGTANPVNLVIAGQLTPNAPVITAVDKNLSSRRPWTTETVKWSVPAWTKPNEKFQTPDLSALLQEIIDQDGWAADNALLLLLRDDKDKPSIGLREAEAFEGDATAAPLLHLEVLWPE